VVSGNVWRDAAVREYEAHLQTKRDGKVLVDWYVLVEPYLDDAGRYQEPNDTRLDYGVIWKGKTGFRFEPETNLEAKFAGRDLQSEFRDEIDEQVRDQIGNSMEYAD
jgi:hypothetical protein